MQRRHIIAGLALAPALTSPAFAAPSYASFVQSLRGKALAAGIPQTVVTAATASLTTPNPTVLKFDHHQAEFTQTYAHYSAHVLNAARIAEGQKQYDSTASIFAAITSRFGVAAGPMLGIWGLETNYGANQGDFYVIDALATLAWDRQSTYFAKEAIAAMRIIASGDAPVSQSGSGPEASLTGSFAGAMGQPQFMPSVYLSTAIPFAGSGAPDIWNSDGDALASMANYLVKAGWQADQPASEPVFARLASADGTGRENMRTLGYWLNHGVQRLPGAAQLPSDFPAGLLLPDGVTGQAFLIYPNFMAIRRYNPSDFYTLATDALGRAILA